MTCDRARAAVVASGGPAVDAARHPAEARHLATCPECRRWAEAYAEGAALWAAGAPGGDEFAARVLARTSGSACDRARTLLASAADDPIGADDAALAAAHVAGCGGCRAFAADLEAVRASLPALADLDPGPDFTMAVLARTSRRPAVETWLDRVRDVADRLVSRPRIAWEAAYVVTLCWLVLFGPPVVSLDWTTARVSAVSAESLPAPVRAAKSAVQGRMQTWRERWTGQAADLAEAASGGRTTAAQALGGVQRAFLDWWARETAGLGAFLRWSWDAVVAWAETLFGDGTSSENHASPTEPPAAPMRSRK